jgi:hypothetical protein
MFVIDLTSRPKDCLRRILDSANRELSLQPLEWRLTRQNHKWRATILQSYFSSITAAQDFYVSDKKQILFDDVSSFSSTPLNVLPVTLAGYRESLVYLSHCNGK